MDDASTHGYPGQVANGLQNGGSDDDLSRVFVHVEAAAPERKQPGGFAIADDLAIVCAGRVFSVWVLLPGLLGSRRHHGPGRFLEHLINGHRESVREGQIFSRN